MEVFRLRVLGATQESPDKVDDRQKQHGKTIVLVLSCVDCTSVATGLAECSRIVGMEALVCRERSEQQKNSPPHASPIFADL